MTDKNSNLNNYSFAASLSSYNEQPTLTCPDMVLRFFYSENFQGNYFIRLQNDGVILGKYASGKTEVKPGNLNTETLALTANKQTEIQSRLAGIQGRLMESEGPPQILTLDGGSYTVEVPAVGNVYVIQGVGAYPEPFEELRQILISIRASVSEFERRVFGMNHFISKLSITELNRLLGAELDSTIALVFRFVPTDNMIAFLDSLEEPRGEAIRFGVLGSGNNFSEG